MNKKQLPVLLSSFLLLGALFATVSAQAESTEGAIAVVDVQKILQNAPQVNVMKEKLNADFAARRNQLLTAQKTLKADMDKLQNASAKMDKKSLESLQQKSESEQRELQMQQLAFQKDLFAAQDKALQDLLEVVKGKIGVVAEQKQLRIVLVKSSVAYARDKDTPDITGDVLKLLK